VYVEIAVESSRLLSTYFTGVMKKKRAPHG